MKDYSITPNENILNIMLITCFNKFLQVLPKDTICPSTFSYFKSCPVY
jgi:hypothetical protein